MPENAILKEDLDEWHCTHIPDYVYATYSSNFRARRVARLDSTQGMCHVKMRLDYGLRNLYRNFYIGLLLRASTMLWRAPSDTARSAFIFYNALL